MRAADPRIVLGLYRSRYERHLLRGALDLGVQAIDTSFNYLGFRAHETLAKVARDLLPKFSISTKVGFFPGPERAEHSIDPGRLRAAIEQTARTLGQEPDLVFLHSPEQSVTQLSEGSARHCLADACSVLADAREQGLCRAWGVASWDPRPLAAIVGSDLPRPDVLMVRGGLFVGIGVLEAVDCLTERWKPSAMWGMSPFGGSTAEPVWNTFDPRLFLCDPEQDCSAVQAAFRCAYHLPVVDAVAVGTDNLDHLRELTDSLGIGVDEVTVRRYRRLLRDRCQED
ncbi:aldo/keto reductase [Streptomyces iranensis]|uniref:aldo/keto reductase n=1 Tax=Streptomyces iranensis TaxID=576784 RepID=UPI0039B72CCD